MNIKEYIKQWAESYKTDLTENIMPFWMEHGWDKVNGGVYTCLDRDGSLIDTTKSVWFQGRFAFICAYAYNNVEENPMWLEAAKSTLDFIEKHCFDENGRMYFSVTAEGKPLRMRRYVFSETFAAIAMSEYALATGDQKYAERALQIFKDTQHFLTTPGILAPKFEESVQLQSHSIIMILINVASCIRKVINDPIIDSLSAIKYAKVKVVRDENGLATGFEIEGDFPKYGNDDDRADEIGVWLLKTFLEMIKKRHTYRNSEATTSILTITSNVVYGKYTGALPDGRTAFTPFAPGATPSYGAEQNGLLASLNSVAKLPYHWALDGISNTQTINPEALGHSEGERVENLVQVLDGYFDQGAHHLNVNVFGKEKLLDAMEHPEKEEYANFTIRVSGYAVKFIDLTREQQLDVLARTCHGVL